MKIRYLALSDLHLGAQNSVLTNLAVDGAYNRGAPGPVLEQLATVIHRLSEADDTDDSDDPPELVLAGDLFELALTTTDVAADTFTQFVRQLCDVHRGSVAPRIVFVPGNHDHHLWEAARESQYVEYLRGVPVDEELRRPWHVTHLLPENDRLPARDHFVSALAERALGRDDVHFRIVYPNYGLVTDDGDRAVVFHHGHYVESMYRLMDVLHRVLRPERDLPELAFHIEADNFAWVDFFWSTMGRAGDAGADIGLLYELLQSEDAVEQLASRLTDLAVRSRSVPARIEAWFLRRVAREIVSLAVRRERHNPEVVLSPGAEKGLDAYVGTAVRAQLEDEVGRVPDETTFVFGHTHKPFARRQAVEGFADEIQVFNTGGWVVDTPEAETIKGAQLVVIDEHLHVAGIELFRQHADADDYEVAVRGLSGGSGPLESWLRDVVDADEDPWRSFSDAAAVTVHERTLQLDARIAEGRRRLGAD